MPFIVKSRGSKFICDTVVAPVGYYRMKDGTVKRDGTPSPEMGSSGQAYHFETHRSAARTASKLSDPIIKKVV